METFVCEYDTYNKDWLDINGINTINGICAFEMESAAKLHISRHI